MMNHTTHKVMAVALAAAIVAGVVDSFATKMLGKIRVDDEGERVFQHNTYARRR